MNKMQVPPSFIKEHKKMLAKTCSLKTDQAGKSSWETKIVREKSNYFICEGEWPHFVVHHKLEMGDVLIFLLIEKSTFRVQPYTQKCYRNFIQHFEELSSSSSEEDIGPSRKLKRAKKVDTVTMSDSEEESDDTSSSDDESKKSKREKAPSSDDSTDDESSGNNYR
ncbi:B3 domain-containing protein REM13-like [Lycium barbarum]|uniref:B3 domain-containing protein REM13-like n=1 Tax=Lycium barbarum TaxID=112863 RepID=UPI00293E7B4A|nr:B3 domain-containing protein REM13-like [Lycium barbarum]